MSGSLAPGAGDEILQVAYSDAPADLGLGVDAEPYLAGEWYTPELIDGREARWMGRQGVAFVRVPAGAHRLGVRARTLHPMATQEPVKLEVTMDGTAVGKANLDDHEWHDTVFDLQAKPSAKGRIAQVRFAVEPAWIPAEFNPASTDTRSLALLVERIWME